MKKELLKKLQKIKAMEDGELLARYAKFSELYGVAQFKNDDKQIEELGGELNLMDSEILNRMAKTTNLQNQNAKKTNK